MIEEYSCRHVTTPDDLELQDDNEFAWVDGLVEPFWGLDPDFSWVDELAEPLRGPAPKK